MKKLFLFLNLRRNILIDLLFIFFLSLTPLLWFQGNSVMLGHDNVFPLKPLVFLDGRLSTWIEHGVGQSQTLIMGTIPIHFIDALPSIFGFSLQVTQKIVYVFWFFMMGISAYMLARVINKESRVFKLTAVILYQFNFFILQGWFIGERTKFSAYIALPLVLAVFFKVRRKEISILRGAVLNSLILFVLNGGGLFGISLFGGLFVCIGSFILLTFLFGYFDKEFKTFKRIVAVTLLTIFGFLLVNSYYIFPALSEIFSRYGAGLVKSGGVSGFIDWASEISANASFINLLRLQGIAEWYDNPYHPYAKYFLTNPVLIIVSFSFLFLILGTLLLYKKREKLELVLFFFLMFLLGIFFTAGTHPPTGFLYELFMKYIPGSAAFRSPYFKFAPAIFFASSFLIAFFVDSFKGNIKKTVFIAVISITFLYHFPYFTGNFFSWKPGFSTRLDVPSYVFDFGKWLNEEKSDDGRVLLLPPNSPDSQQSSYDWGYLSFQSLPTFLSNKSVIVNNDRIYDEEREPVMQLYEAIARGDKVATTKIAGILRVKYFLLQHDASYDKSQSITDESNYQKVLTKDFQLKPQKQFGEWDLFQIEDHTLSAMYLNEKIDLFEGSIKNISDYYSFSNNKNFVVDGDDRLVNPISIPQNLSTDFYIPKCINCPNKNKPLVIFPQLNILPDSPLYPLVILKENTQTRAIDPKNAIYDNIGISLKRISELRDNFFVNKDQEDAIFVRYDAVLKDIIKNFRLLDKYEDKIQVADDIQYYMTAERNFILPVLGSLITHGKSISLFGRIIQRIASVVSAVDPYLFKLDIANNRLYQVSINKTEDFELFIKKEDLTPVLGGNEKVTVEVDGRIKKEAKIDLSSVSNVEWLSFGKVNLTEGTHQLLLSYPQLPNNLGEIKENKTEFNVSLENTCFTSKLINIYPRKTYKVDINYQNDFSEDLYFYVWELKVKERNLIDVLKLKTGLADETFSELIKTQEETEGVEIGVCSRILNSDIISRKIKFNVNEIIYPTLMFVPVNKKSEIVRDVDFRKISPTKYTISFVNNSDTSILTFLERFDNNWELSSFGKNHFRTDGYANGWLIDKKGTFSLTLEYAPQKKFILGVLFSAVTVIIFIIYLIVGRKRKHDFS